MSLDRRLAGRLFALCLALVLLSTAPAMAQRINEIRIDQPGTDVDEYIEIVGPANAFLDDLFIIVIGDGAGSIGQGAVEEIIDLDGLQIKANGAFLIAQPGFDDDGEGGSKFGWLNPDLEVPLNLENNDNVTYMLVRDLSGTVGINTDLDVDDNCAIDSLVWGELVDLVRVFDVETGGDCTYVFPPFTNPADPNTMAGPRKNCDTCTPYAPAHVLKTELGPWVVGKEDPALLPGHKGVKDTPRLQNGSLTFNGLAFPGNTVNFTTWAPGEDGASALVLLSCTPGALPGIPLPGDGRRVPLVFDSCTSLGLTLSAILTGTVANDGTDLAETFEVPFPNYNPIFSGVPIQAAVVTSAVGSFIGIYGPISFTLL